MKLRRTLTYIATFAAGAIAVAAVTVFDSSNSLTSTASDRVAQGVSSNQEPAKKKLQQSEVVVASEQNPETNITAIVNLERNTRVVIEGVVQRTREEDEFVLEDDTGSVQVFTGVTFFPVEVGERVTVTGFVDESLLLEVYAEEIIHQDGRVTKIDY